MKIHELQLIYVQLKRFNGAYLQRFEINLHLTMVTVFDFRSSKIRVVKYTSWILQKGTIFWTIKVIPYWMRSRIIVWFISTYVSIVCCNFNGVLLWGVLYTFNSLFVTCNRSVVMLGYSDRPAASPEVY